MRWTALVLLGGLSACTSPPPPPANDAAVGPDLAPIYAMPDFLMPDLFTPDLLTFPPDDAGNPPLQACGTDAAVPDAGQCALPPSECIDANWLVYYEGGACVDGQCRWTKQFIYCDLQCIDGGCNSGFT